MSNRLARLYQEHLGIAARYEDAGLPFSMPARYGDGVGERESFSRGAALADLDGIPTFLFHGDPAPDFAGAAFAGRELSVGECAFEASLTGDGSLASIALLARTGDQEYVFLDPSRRHDTLSGWLSFLSQVSQNGYAPYEGLKTEPVENGLVPLLLWGERARVVLSDYVPSAGVLPGAGRVTSINLDRIPCLVFGLPAGPGDCYLIMVPPQNARALWRSFLSFTEVTPVGHEALSAQVEESLPWVSSLKDDGRLAIDPKTLASWRVIRPEGGFVGARALGL